MSEKDIQPKKTKKGFTAFRITLVIIIILSVFVSVYSFIVRVDIMEHDILSVSHIFGMPIGNTPSSKEPDKMNNEQGNVHIYPYPARVWTDYMGILYIGDSRMVGMDMACHISSEENCFVIAKEGEGYYYLINEALPEANRIKAAHPEITEWIYVLALGVNDMEAVESYISKYEELAQEYPVYVVSVNPAEGAYGHIAGDIEAFNRRLQMLDGTFYIDTYSILLDIGFNAPDGLHYSYSTYEDIYNIMNEAMGRSKG